MTSGGPAPAYLDHAASSPLRPEVAEAMAAVTARSPGNASSGHGPGRAARRALEEARETVAAHLGAEPAEVVFTSGGTEADNLAVLGVLEARSDAGRSPIMVCSAVEHPAVLAPARWAAGRGASLRLAPVDHTGAVVPDALGDRLDEEVALVSVMAANNEVGTVQPLAAVAATVRRRSPEAVLHTDAVQAAPWLDLAETTAGFDLVSVSGHKLGGPTGIGALVVRSPTVLVPRIHGGGQEQERRSGTSHVAGAVGLAAALAAAARGRQAETARVVRLRDDLADGVAAKVEGVVETVPREAALPGHLHLQVPGVDREELLVLLDRSGVSVSGGAACASGALEDSHVLAAMDLDPAGARGALRLSLGWSSTPADVDRAVVGLADAVGRLRP